MPNARFMATLAAIALLALFGAEAARFSLWTTSDEPAHLAAARAWRHGPGMVSNFEHPVLMKLFAGAFLPREKPAMEIEETRAGRAPMAFIFLGLALVTGLLGRALAGNAAGLAAAALVATEPTLRGHGALVQSDVLVTFFFVAAALTLERAARAAGGMRAARVWLGATGVLYGFAMASKYSAFPFLAVFAMFAMLRLAAGSTGRFSSKVNERGAGRSKRADDSTRAGGRPRSLHFLRDSLRALPNVLLFLAVPALVTLFLIQSLALAGTSDDAFRAAIAREFKELPQERAAVSLARTYPKAVAAYGAGLLFVQGVAGPGERFNYFFGEVSGKGHPLYFPVALGVKLTTATVLAMLASLLVALILLVREPRRRRILAARAWLPAALGGAYLAAACASNVNIGVRHALPAVPFLLVAAAGAGRALLARRPRAFRAALAAVVFLAAGESAFRLGREISFGNFLAGGPAGIPAILSDSNVDWGQEQGQVYGRVRRGDLGRVGLTSLIVDESGARAVGIAGQAMSPDAPVDTVFFSRFLWDTAAAIEKNTEAWPKFVWLRGWLPRLRHGLESRAISVEPFGDAQLLLRLREVEPARARPFAAPAPTK
ncbi:MAG: phospholipid carrier-dependent glycosyltransferase [Thermoanaerobaculia bacterium]|nr:phospholipid carrier-dependent glycosyltransferase [Thermoanaerobaculia bacterium]